MKSDILKELKWRGIINNITDENKLIKILNSKEDVGVYCGFDPSFKSLHLGNYVMVKVLSWFKKYGIKTIAVVGGGTGMIGDPSGKSQERNLLSAKEIKNNIDNISNQLKKLTHADIIFNNAEIWEKMSVIDFLRDVGKNFNINTMLEKDIVKNRLETGISFTEFSYSILQSYDWIILYQKYHVCIQCGGSDQWGNLTAGTNLFRKLYGEEHQAVGITINLLLQSNGKKFGKSEKGAIYFDKEVTSCYEMYQFLINQNDDDLLKLFYFFSDYNQKEINEIIKQHQLNPKIRYGQKQLASLVISDIHGQDELKNCERLSKIMFNEEYASLTIKELDDIFKNYETIKFNTINIKLIELLKNFHIIPSNREIRTLIEQKGLKINGNLIEDENLLVDNKFLIHNKYLLIKKGKKNFFIMQYQK